MSNFAIINNGVNIMQQDKHSSEEYFNQPFKDLKKLLQKKMKENNHPFLRKGGVTPPLQKSDAGFS